VHGSPESKMISRAEVYAVIDYLGDVGAELERGGPAELQKLYAKLRREMIYHADEKAIVVAVRPGRDRERVRGGLKHVLLGNPLISERFP
jgi:hypothetical protein